MLRAELRPAETAQRIVAVSANEADIIREHVRRSVTVLSYPALLRPTAAPWRARQGLLFVGAAAQIDGPNGDSLVQLLNGPMQAWAAQGTRLRVAGRGTGPGGWLAAHAGPQVELVGTVADLVPLYDAALAFVAPTRYGAGIPIKVLDAARHGLPVIASPFVAVQLGWRDGEELLVARDHEDWVVAAQRLARDEPLWQGLRARALDAVQRGHGPERFASGIGEAAFGDAGGYGTTDRVPAR
jgi:glycosyltransferase involved in cell wall biosynthesis